MALYDCIIRPVTINSPGMPSLKPTTHTWLCTGDIVFPAMLEAIHSAQRTIRLETYIYAPDTVGDKFREALIQARERGVKVQVLIDALGSYGLPSNYWEPLKAVGGEAL